MEEPSSLAAASSSSSSSAAVAYESDQSTEQKDEIADHEVDQRSTTASTALDLHDLDSESKPKFSQSDIIRAVEVVERDSLAIADSFSSLFSSLRLALSEVTNRSVDHMQCFADAAGQLQETTLVAATKGNRVINSCLRLNEEMKGVDSLATRLKILRRNVDALDSAVNKLLRPP